jgi:DNA-binding transcriptional regulator YdaS (Cro superfamily)
MKKEEALRKVINKVGSGAELGRKLGVSNTIVWDWVGGRKPIPAKLVRKLVELSQGEITESDLRPDIFYPINLDQKKEPSYRVA